MRYVASAQELVLLQKNGARRHRFFNGELVVGDPTLNTLAADKIDFSVRTDDGETLMRIYDTDAAGKAEADSGVDLGQLCGLGALATGVRGLFFEAPPIEIGATAVPATKGLWYKVIKGEVSYAGKTYRINEIFCADGTTVVAAGETGSLFGLIYYKPRLDEKGDRNAHFKLKHLMVGDETPDYHFYDVSGFEPRNGMTTTDIGIGAGWTRP